MSHCSPEKTLIVFTPVDDGDSVDDAQRRRMKMLSKLNKKYIKIIKVSMK